MSLWRNTSRIEWDIASVGMCIKRLSQTLEKFKSLPQSYESHSLPDSSYRWQELWLCTKWDQGIAILTVPLKIISSILAFISSRMVEDTSIYVILIFLYLLANLVCFSSGRDFSNQNLLRTGGHCVIIAVCHEFESLVK